MKGFKSLPKYLPPRDKNPKNKKDFKYIPKKIFQTWETNKVTPGMYDAVHTWIDKNPDWEYHFFDKDDRRNFIKDNFPKKVLDAYDALIPGAFKADLWRYCVLYIHGGVYVDSKVELMVSLNNVIPSDIEFLSVKDKVAEMSEPFGSYILQAFICSKPNHRFLEKVIDLIVENVSIGYYGLEPISPTGPGALGKAINLVLKRREGHVNLIGENVVSNFKYILWSIKKVSGDTCIKDINNNLIFKMEYGNYRRELSSLFNTNTACYSYRFCWCFNKVYTHNKVKRPIYNSFFKKQFLRQRLAVIKNFYKNSDDKSVVRSILWKQIRKGDFVFSSNLIWVFIKYEFIYPFLKILKLKK